MEPVFSFETDYDLAAFASMAGALRKTVRKKHSCRAHIFGWVVVAVGILTLIIGGMNLFTLAAVVIVLAVLLFEDRINGRMAMRKILPGMAHAKTDFYEDHYVSVTEMGTTEWHYDKIKALAEDGNYFVLIFSQNHAQVYAGKSLKGGTDEEFCRFMERKTGLEMQKLKQSVFSRGRGKRDVKKNKG